MRDQAKFPTDAEVMAAIEEDDCLGFCLACGAEASGVEPDARRYKCEGCGAREVYGAEECLVMGAFRVAP
jgi:hypothetical protein